MQSSDKLWMKLFPLPRVVMGADTISVWGTSPSLMWYCCPEPGDEVLLEAAVSNVQVAGIRTGSLQSGHLTLLGYVMGWMLVLTLAFLTFCSKSGGRGICSSRDSTGGTTWEPETFLEPTECG